MSAHYTLLLSLPLKPSLVAANAAVLNFLFNDKVQPPAVFPDHAYF